MQTNVQVLAQVVLAPILLPFQALKQMKK